MAAYEKGSRPHLPIEQTPLYVTLVELSHWVWKTVQDWDEFARSTVGKQVVRACDSVAANLVEGDGRFSQADAIRFLIYARGSARETAHWFRISRDRGLVDRKVIDEKIAAWNSACRDLNGLINYRRKNTGVVKEERAMSYVITEHVSMNEDEFAEWLNSWPAV